MERLFFVRCEIELINFLVARRHGVDGHELIVVFSREVPSFSVRPVERFLPQRSDILAVLRRKRHRRSRINRRRFRTAAVVIIHTLPRYGIHITRVLDGNNGRAVCLNGFCCCRRECKVLRVKTCRRSGTRSRYGRTNLRRCIRASQIRKAAIISIFN